MRLNIIFCTFYSEYISTNKKIPWRRKWQLTPVFLPGDFHGQRSLAGYSPQGHKELNSAEQLSTDKRLCKKLFLCDRWILCQKATVDFITYSGSFFPTHHFRAFGNCITSSLKMISVQLFLNRSVSFKSAKFLNVYLCISLLLELGRES